MMTDSLRRRLRHGSAYAFLMTSAALVAFAPAAHAQTTDSTPAAETGDTDESQDIVVVGSGETRSVSTLLPSNLDTLPPAPASRRR